MNIQVNDWVIRVPFPVVRVGFGQTYENILINTAYRVDSVDQQREALVLCVIYEGEVWHEEFWAGNFKRVTLEPILGE